MAQTPDFFKKHEVQNHRDANVWDRFRGRGSWTESKEQIFAGCEKKQT